MKYLFKVIVLFLIIFNFKIPVLYYSCTLGVVLCVLYYVIFKRSISLTYIVDRHCFIILACTLFMAIINLSVTTFYGNFYILGFKRFIVQGYMLLCLVFSLPFLIERKSTAFENMIVVLCGAFALQGLIHTVGFLVTPVGDFLFSLQNVKFQEAAEDVMRNVDRFRFYSLTGSPFFELPAAYGVASIMFFRLQLIPDQEHLRGWKAFVIMLLMIMGISLSGRTGFVGVSFGLFIYIIFNWYDFPRIWRNVVKISGGFLCLLVVFYTVLTPQQRDRFENKLLPFAFEAFYSWRATGKFETASTDALMEVHYYPIDTETLLWGKGGNSDDNVGYRHTDAGYMNDIIYGGIFYLLLLAIYQFLYFYTPIRLARYSSKQKRIDLCCFLFLYIYMFVLHYKGPALGTQHITEVLFLFIGIAYIEKCYAQEEYEIVQVGNST